MLIAFAVGALGNLLGAAVTGTTPVWDVTLDRVPVLRARQWSSSLLIGFMLGVLIRTSTGAIVAYFVLTFAAAHRLRAAGRRASSWFHDLQPWVDIQFAQSGLFVFDAGAHR